MIIDMEEIAKTDKESVKLPEKLQKQSMWLVFREALASYLSQKEGTGRIPLSYINHDLDVLIQLLYMKQKGNGSKQWFCSKV